MLLRLYIRNFTLIDELDIDLHRGFSVVTGETGAGKSIIVGAIGLLLGNRADSKQVKPGQQKCVIEAHFDISQYGMERFFTDNDIDFDPTDCILRREISSSGKSRGFINDTPAPLAKMRELGEMLIDVHSQHQNLLLNKEDFQLSVVDIIAHDAEQKAQYNAKFSEYLHAKKELDALRERIQSSRDNEDFMRFQCTELENASLVEGEQEQIEAQVDTLNHVEEIKSALFEVDRSLMTDDNNVVDSLRTAAQRLHDIEDVYPEVKELAERMDSSYIDVKDIAREISNMAENVDFDPQSLDSMNARLDAIYSLEQKYHVQTEEELIAIYKSVREQLDHIENSDEELAEMQGKVEAIRSECLKLADVLTAMRREAIVEVEKQMQQRLAPLGIPNVRFRVELSERELSHDGKDKVSFLFSANKSTELQPVSQVASGGEIARVMLSLKAMISGAVKLPTIIFDEIDTGVSGRVAEKMAQIMREMGDNRRQVISITHLPQIAAMGQFHYKVQKSETAEGTVSEMHELGADERIREIAQMLSGEDVTDAAISNAKELLSKANN
jgi:DNA repair protein RecN (Recombination protein N)